MLAPIIFPNLTNTGYVNKLTGSEEDALEPGKEIYTLWGLCMKVLSKYYGREGDARLHLQGRD